MKKLFALLAILPSLLLSSCGGCKGPNSGGGDVPPDPPGPIDPPVVEKSITFSRESISLFLNDTYQINYSIEGFSEEERETLLWNSTNTSVATVNSTGFVTANNVGQAVISATIDEYSASLAVTVMNSDEIPYFTCIEVLEVYTNEVLSFNENTKFKGEDVLADYSYVSSDNSIVNVEGTTVTAIHKGVADVTITSSYKGYNSSLTCHVTVTEVVEVILNKEKVVLAPASYTGTAFIKEEQLSVEAYVNNQLYEEATFIWESDDETVATVDNGLVTSVNLGETIVTVSTTINEEVYSKKALVVVETPKNYIEETLVVNINTEHKILDLTPVGLENSEVISIHETYKGVTKTLVFEYHDGLLYLEGIDESYSFTTRILEVEIGQEIYTMNVQFKEYVKDKLYFADAASHLDCISGRNGNLISYDPDKSLPLDQIAAGDRALFANEGRGSTKIQMTGINEEGVVLLNPEFTDVSSYSYIVFYVYTFDSGYSSGAWWTGDATLVPGQWTRVVISDFDNIMDTNGVYIKDKGYDITNFVVRFNNYVNPNEEAVIWMSSIYACAPEQDYIVSEVSRTVSDYTKVMAIEILRPIEGLTVELDLGDEDTLYYGAITVEDGSHWVEVKAGGGFDKWYRKEGSASDWWTKMGVWEEFTDTSDSEGKITINAGWYATDPAIGDSGLITAGTRIYVAVKVAPIDDFEFVTPDKTYNDYTVYAAKVLRKNSGFVIEIDAGDPGKAVLGAVTVDHGQKWVEVKAGNIDKWFRKEWDEDWWTRMGVWEAFTDTIDENGKITVTTGIYGGTDVGDGGPMSVGTIVYVALKVVETPEPESDYAISTPADKEYGDYTVYAITVLRATAGFSCQIDLGVANQAYLGAITVDKGDNWVNVKADGFDKWYRKESAPTDWWTRMGTWEFYNVTSSEEGLIDITVSWYETDPSIPDSGNITVGTTIYVAVKAQEEPPSPEDIYSIDLAGDKSFEDYTVYAITVLQENEGFTCEIDFGVANQSVIGAISVDHGHKWVEVKAGNGFDKWFRKDWSYGDWWSGMGTWEIMTDTTDENGKISITTGIYATSDVPDYGPMSVGTVIYVALKEYEDPLDADDYVVDLATDKSYEDYTVYAITVINPINGFDCEIDFGSANTDLIGAITVDHGEKWVEVKAGNGFDKWYRKEGSASDWWTKMGVWETFSDTTDENGKISITTGIYATSDVPDYGPFSAGTVIYVALKDASAVSIYSITRDFEKVVEGYEYVFCLEILMNTNSFEAVLNLGTAGLAINGKYTIECSEGVWFQPQIGNSTDKYFNTGSGWWVTFGTYVEFSATTNSEGKIVIQLNDYLGAQLPAGSKMYIAFNI